MKIYLESDTSAKWFSNFLLAYSVFFCAAFASAEGERDENIIANALFETLFEESLARSPEYQSYLGIKDNQDKWDNISEAYLEETHKLHKSQLKRLKTINKKKLNDQTALSLALYKKKLSDSIHFYKWRHHNYPVNQMFGKHSMVPSFLINVHKISDEKDARDYIARLQGLDTLFDQLIDGLELRKKKGVIAPSFVFPHVRSDSINVITGFPFDKKDDSTIMADFRKKVSALEIDKKIQVALLKDAEESLLTVVGPAYQKLIAYLDALEKSSDTRDGVWKLPSGKSFYRDALAKTTTTELSADDIHNIGVKEVSRIHGEMREIMKTVKFKGSLNDFFEFMRNDEQFYYPQTEAGKARYLSEATEIIDTMKAELDDLFITKPKADLIVKAVEPFREKSAGKAFYQRPAPDGSRPGTYYANLYNMKNMPSYQMEALAYHEGVPGHHMQISIAQELEGIPKFRKFGSYTAYIEGWGLYSEFIPKEMGYYKDPYSDFGRLAMELWRACRLVVDTGIHAKKWTRQQAIDYLVENTPNPENDAERAIERYIVMPSQATAYKIGMNKILELRAFSKNKLGDKFDIREFHDVILKDGPVPLDILETLVQNWVASKGG